MRNFIQIIENFMMGSMREPIVEMANLREPETGISGLIYVSSSEQARHGPRIKYFPTGSGASSQPSYVVDISADPHVITQSRALRKQIPSEVLEWVRLNHAELRRFWDEANDWSPRQIADFADGLQRLG